MPRVSPPTPCYLRTLAVGLAVLFGVACASSHPPRFVESQRLAERAYSAGRYEEAARRWEEAARHATDDRKREEAEYRRAQSLLRAKHYREARAVFTPLSQGVGERAGRAAVDLARLEIAVGSPEKGYADLLRAAVHHCRLGVARSALLSYLIWSEQQGGAVAALSALVPLLESTRHCPLDQDVRHHHARYLEKIGRYQSALAAYLELARRYPYPKGAYWDDALFRAALLEERTGDPRAAIARLTELLGARESSAFVGSYERPRFAEARFRIATLYRDALGDDEAAARQFRLLWQEHSRSRLRDDAAWELAQLRSRNGDLQGSCEWLAALVREYPESRYAACATELCPQMAKRGRCHDYLRPKTRLNLTP